MCVIPIFTIHQFLGCIFKKIVENIITTVIILNKKGILCKYIGKPTQLLTIVYFRYKYLKQFIIIYQRLVHNVIFNSFKYKSALIFLFLFRNFYLRSAKTLLTIIANVKVIRRMNCNLDMVLII